MKTLRPVSFRIPRRPRQRASTNSSNPSVLVGSIAKYSRGLALTAVAAFGVSEAKATVLFWDVASGDGATITDGAGNRSNGGGNWNNGTGNTTWNNSTPDNATFGGGTSGTAGTVKLSSTNITV